MLTLRVAVKQTEEYIAGGMCCYTATTFHPGKAEESAAQECNEPSSMNFFTL